MVDICHSSEFPEGGTRLVTVTESGHGRNIVIFREGDRFYAIDELCTHVGASHTKSVVKDGVLECWLHKGQFCLESGAPLRYPARRPAQVHDVYVDDQGMVQLFPGERPRDAS